MIDPRAVRTRVRSARVWSATKAMYNRPKLGEILLKHGSVTREALQRALSEQHTQATPQRLGKVLLAHEAVSEVALLRALGEQFGMMVVERFDPEKIDVQLSRDLPYGFSTEHMVMPYERKGPVVLTALADPLNVRALDLVRSLVGAEPVPVLAPHQVIRDLITAVFDRRGDLDALVDDLDRDATKSPADLDDAVEKIEDLLSRAADDDEGPIIQLVNTVFQQSVRERASDIHIEPAEDCVMVRFRVDGVLHEAVRAPKRFQNSIVVRIKIMANLNIAEKRLPQDGRIRFRIAGRDIDVRVATAPSAFGERITMRLLDKQAVLLDLDDLGFAPRNREILEHHIHQPHGIILVTGPTGSGKTTTLYASLSRINTPDKNILTVEDPVEYQIPGISQMQVNPKIGLTFASGLRSYLRHDPDVILVGEIRDVETAEIAIQAALTGHLVFSTIHTNDAAGAFTRLIDMGVEPFRITSALSLSMAQRLVRRLCKVCKVPYEPTPEQLEELSISPEELAAAGGVFHRAVGCPECNNSGYSGRAAIHEMLEVDDESRHLVMQRMDAGAIKAAAVRKGMRTMRDDGAWKVLRGVTSLEEVVRVTHDSAL